MVVSLKQGIGYSISHGYGLEAWNVQWSGKYRIYNWKKCTSSNKHCCNTSVIVLIQSLWTKYKLAFHLVPIQVIICQQTENQVSLRCLPSNHSSCTLPLIRPVNAVLPGVLYDLIKCTAQTNHGSVYPWFASSPSIPEKGTIDLRDLSIHINRIL